MGGTAVCKEVVLTLDSGNLFVKFSKRMNLFALFYILMLAVCALAQPSAQDLQDSLDADSLSKISLALDVDTNGVVDTNKVKRIDAGIERRNSRSKDFSPEGFVVEAAYAAPTALHLSLFGGRDKWVYDGTLKKYDFFYGVPIVSLDIDEWMVSDEGILSLILIIASMESSESAFGTLIKLDYLLFGNTYFSLSDNGRIGLFETHRILDYGIYSLAMDGKAWEFGFSEALGLRFVLSKNYWGSGYYVDLGGHVRITNQRFCYGLFVQLGGFSTHK